MIRFLSLIWTGAWLLSLAPAALAADAALAEPPKAAAEPAAGPALSLPQLIAMARRAHPALAASRTRVEAAQADLITARARPNPEFDLQLGRLGATHEDVLRGVSGSMSLLQPIERSGVRRTRQDVAVSGIQVAQADVQGFERSFLAQLKLRYFEALRLQSAAALAQEDLLIADQIRTRVSVRVSSGEAPRFELIRADTEQLNAHRAAQAARLRVDQARAELASSVGPELPANYVLSGQLSDLPDTPAAIQTLRADMLARHPELRAARAQVQAAHTRVEFERQRAGPSFALRAGVDRVPGALDARVGVLVSLPLFDRREGPIASAQAHLEQARRELADRELQLDQALTVAWQRYQIARAQVGAYEAGILPQAQAALRVAEAAYRYGERGILDYLDAQRTLRSLRNELNATRFELHAANVELERLGTDTE